MKYRGVGSPSPRMTWKAFVWNCLKDTSSLLSVLVCKKKSTFTWTKKYFLSVNPDCVDPAHHANGFMTSFDCFKLGGKKQNFCIQVVTNYTAVQWLKTRMQTLAVLSLTISQSKMLLFSRYIQLISPPFKCAEVAILVWILSKYNMLKFIVLHVLITTVWTYNQSHC